MKPRLSVLLALLLPVTATLLPGQTTPAPASAAPEDATELEEKMDKLNSAFRKLKRQVSDPGSNASSLELIAVIRKAADDSIAFAPAKAASLPANKRDEFVAAYRAKMKLFIDEVAKLEAAIAAGKNSDAAKLVADLGAMQKEGHKEFKRPKKDDSGPAGS